MNTRETFTTTLQPVILCGGSGSRLWPLSREQYPKQLLALTGDETLLQATARRVPTGSGIGGGTVLPPLVVGNEEYRFITVEQMNQVDVSPGMVIIEPEGRNTAPALTLAALAATESGEDPVLVAMPADQVIGDISAFRAALDTAVGYALKQRVVTLGIKPTHAESGYGYIRMGKPVGKNDNARSIVAFVEKPDHAIAERYVSGNEYLWNSGIFVMHASVWLRHLAEHRRDILTACELAFAGRSREGCFARIDAAAFAVCPADSIDYAVMENLSSGSGVVVPLAAQWSDVGAWQALWHLSPKDETGNVFQGDVLSIDSSSCLAISQSRLVACVGLDDTVVIETPDAILVARRDQVQKVKDLVLRLKQDKRVESSVHRKVHRPWGCYESIVNGQRFQVKRLMVNPGEKLSLQMHHHRAEHWVVVSGTACVTCGDKTFLLAENESTYIPLGQEHRLENPGRIPLEIIEVQSGSYLGEDDIVRFEDSYGRI